MESKEVKLIQPGYYTVVARHWEVEEIGTLVKGADFHL